MPHVFENFIFIIKIDFINNYILFLIKRYIKYREMLVYFFFSIKLDHIDENIHFNNLI